MIKVLIVDDMKILRECLKMVIDLYPGFTVVGCAADGKEAVELCNELLPDVILMDLNMPLYSGHDAIIEIRAMHREIKILVLSVEEDEGNIAKAFQNGADGYVLKDIDPEELRIVMNKSLKGEKYARDNAFNAGQTHIKNNEYSDMEVESLNIEFTEREKEVLELVIEGLTNEEIAEKIRLSTGRARNIVAELISKCMVKNRTQLAVMAVRENMLLGRQESYYE